MMEDKELLKFTLWLTIKYMREISPVNYFWF